MPGRVRAVFGLCPAMLPDCSKRVTVVDFGPSGLPGGVDGCKVLGLHILPLAFGFRGCSCLV